MLNDAKPSVRLQSKLYPCLARHSDAKFCQLQIFDMPAGNEHSSLANAIGVMLIVRTTVVARQALVIMVAIFVELMITSSSRLLNLHIAFATAVPKFHEWAQYHEGNLKNGCKNTLGHDGL